MEKKKKKFIISLVSAVISVVLCQFLFQHFRDVKNQKQIDAAQTELNEKMNKFETSEELMEEARKEIKDDEIAEASIPMGFFMQPTMIKAVCEPAGHVPRKYIAAINSYRGKVDFDEQMVKIYMKSGASKKQALQMLKETKKMLMDQFKRLFENDYQERLKQQPSLTKRQLCRLFDRYAQEIVSAKMEEIKQVAPKTYEKYFAKLPNE